MQSYGSTSYLKCQKETLLFLKYIFHRAIDNDIQLTAAREKRLKEWKRQWKIDLIQKMNPDWQDLYHNII